MAIVYDQATKKYVDDGSGDPYADGQFGNMYMPGFTGDYNKYGLEPYEQADMNQQFSGLKSMLSVLANPQFNMMVANATGEDTFDFGRLNPGGGITYGTPTAGTAGGVAGAGPSGALAPGAYTPTLTSAMTSGDPLLSDYAQRLAGGENAYALQLELTAPDSGITNQGQIDTYTNAIGRMAQEIQAAGAPQNAKTDPLQSWFAGTGQPNPNEVYSADHIPDSVLQGLGPEYLAGMQGHASTYEKAMKAWDQSDNPYVDLAPKTAPARTAGGGRGEPFITPEVAAGLDHAASAYLGPGSGEALSRLAPHASHAAGAIPGAAGIGAAIQGGVLGKVADAVLAPGRALGLGHPQETWNRLLYGTDARDIEGKLDLGGGAAVPKVTGESPPKSVATEAVKSSPGRVVGPQPEANVSGWGRGMFPYGRALDPATAARVAASPQLEADRSRAAGGGQVGYVRGRGMPSYGTQQLGPVQPLPPYGAQRPGAPAAPGTMPLEQFDLGLDGGASARPSSAMPLEQFDLDLGLDNQPGMASAIGRASLLPPSWLSSDSPTVDGQQLIGRVRVDPNSPEYQAAHQGRWGNWGKSAQPKGPVMLATTLQGQLDSQGRESAERVFQGRAGGDHLVRQILADELAKRGRSPSSDRQAAQMRALRSFGIQI